MKDAKNKTSCGLALFLLALSLPCAIWGGYVVTRVWTWFVVPLGVPRVGLWHAAGLFMVARWFTMDSRNLATDDDDRDKRIAWALLLGILMPAFVLAFGAIYHALGGAS